MYKFDSWVKDEISLALSLTDSSPEKAASAQLTYELNNKYNELAQDVENKYNEMISKIDDVNDNIQNQINVSDGSSIINNDLNNLQTTGKYFVHITKNVTKNPPINVTSDWWIDVYVYGDGTNKKIMQEGRMHGATTSSANTGPANLLVRCYDNSKWGPWQYSYAQFSS